MFLGHPEDSLNILQTGVQLCKEVGNERDLAKLYSLIGIYYMHKGETSKAIKYSENAYEVPEELQDVELMAPIARGFSASCLQAGKFIKVIDIIHIPCFAPTRD